MFSVTSIFVAASALAAAVSAHPTSDHNHVERGALPGSWFHEHDQLSRSLFRRQDDASKPLPAVGSAEWLAKYPPANTPLGDEKAIPAPWIAAYKAAVANGLIAQIPPTTLVQDQDYNTNIVYADGFDASSAEVCSTSVQCYNATDIHEAPDGMFGISFDDGPTDGSKTLYPFLAKNHIRATHFLIGSAILKNPDLFMQAFRMNGDLAVHTYNHPYMTAQSDLAVLAELGWTMQIIHDSTGGRVPRFWRPPYGDMDMRVRSIAEHVFGLTAVMWNKDTNDWAMPTRTAAEVTKELNDWLAGPKSPGLYVLEHELTEDTANIFINTTWEGIKKNGWKAMSVAQIAGKDGWNYANAKDNLGEVKPVTGVETGYSATGTVTLPKWFSGTATTILTTTSATAAPSSAPAPPAESEPGQSQGQQSSATTTSSSPAETKPAGGGAVPQPPTNPGTDQSGTTENQQSGGAAAPAGGNAAGMLRPQVAVTALVAALALFSFA